MLPFAAALIAFVEATREDVEVKNYLCPPNRQPDAPLDWARGMLIGMQAARRWSEEPDIADWLERARLNLFRGLQRHSDDDNVRQALTRFGAHVRPALQQLQRLSAAE